ncbi:DUF2939 domain-containing protein [Diaphorobacter aerolatus]|uniref:DUF2939 domain-containing protein n=2 Tax=Diaphorobacter aerolatus TaxID=1288495 RepID=A0A7H0GQJ2_9BURK|nr:DUF2939 domain-containing protein [Diaphorobacter aerolatus]
MALVFVALLYASPYLAMRSIGKALDARDADALSQYVDYPVLRENIKGKLMSSIADRLPAQDSSNPLGGLGQAIGGMMVGAAVEAMVSPAGVMAMLHSGQLDPRLPPANKARRAPEARPDDASGKDSRDQNNDRNFSVDYQGFSKVRVSRKSDPARAFIFRRDGLMGWKLINVDL